VDEVPNSFGLTWPCRALAEETPASVAGLRFVEQQIDEVFRQPSIEADRYTFAMSCPVDPV